MSRKVEISQYDFDTLYKYLEAIEMIKTSVANIELEKHNSLIQLNQLISQKNEMEQEFRKRYDVKDNEQISIDLDEKTLVANKIDNIDEMSEKLENKKQEDMKHEPE